MSIKTTIVSLIASVLILGGAFYYYRENGNQTKNPVSVKKLEAAAIESKGLREFASNTDAKDPGVSPKDKAMYQEVLADLKLAGDGKDKSQNHKAIDAISATIKKYPSLSQAYFTRATLSLAAESADYQSIASDLENAIKYRSASDPLAPSLAGLYGAKAKVDFESGNYQATLTDLDTVLKSDPSSPNEAINTGATKPEDHPSNSTVLNLNDYNTLIKQFPNDPRTYMYRGLFYSFFTLFDENNFVLAANDYKKAISLNSHSALAYYLLGELYQKSTFFTKEAARDISDITGATGGFKEKQRAKVLEYFKQSIAADPNFKYSYAGAAETLFELKRNSEAIPYYDKVIELDPADAGAYNDRGLAKTATNNYYDATSDFAKAIDFKTSKTDQTTLGMTYENRAAAYAKVMNYENAIDDYGTAIGLKFASVVFLMSLPQIRDLYPEFADLSDQVLLEGLRQKYFPNMSSADFLDNYKHDAINKNEEKKTFKEFVLGDLYTSRGDVHVLSGHFKNAAKDYSRAIYAGSSSIIDRWRLLSKAPGTEYYLDAQTLSFSPGDISLWIKVLDTSRQSYSQQKYQIDCSARKIKPSSQTNYNSLGNVINMLPEQDWENIVPDTLGEVLSKGMCS